MSEKRQKMRILAKFSIFAAFSQFSTIFAHFL